MQHPIYIKVYPFDQPSINDTLMNYARAVYQTHQTNPTAHVSFMFVPLADVTCHYMTNHWFVRHEGLFLVVHPDSVSTLEFIHESCKRPPRDWLREFVELLMEHPQYGMLPKLHQKDFEERQ